MSSGPLADPSNLKGQIIRLPHDVIVVPFQQETSGFWTCVVVASSHPAYPVGGYNIVPHRDELAAGERIPLPAPEPARVLAVGTRVFARTPVYDAKDAIVDAVVTGWDPEEGRYVLRHERTAGTFTAPATDVFAKKNQA